MPLRARRPSSRLWASKSGVWALGRKKRTDLGHCCDSPPQPRTSHTSYRRCVVSYLIDVRLLCFSSCTFSPSLRINGYVSTSLSPSSRSSSIPGIPLPGGVCCTPSFGGGLVDLGTLHILTSPATFRSILSTEGSSDQLIGVTQTKLIQLGNLCLWSGTTRIRQSTSKNIHDDPCAAMSWKSTFKILPEIFIP